MTAATYDITLEQGATLSITFTWKDSNGNPYDLTGYTARMQIRKSFSATDTIADATTANGQIVITPLIGQIVVTIPDSVTELATGKKAVYDIELVSGAGIVTRLAQGDVKISKEVTK